MQPSEPSVTSNFCCSIVSGKYTTCSGENPDPKGLYKFTKGIFEGATFQQNSAECVYSRYGSMWTIVIFFRQKKRDSWETKWRKNDIFIIRRFPEKGVTPRIASKTGTNKHVTSCSWIGFHNFWTTDACGLRVLPAVYGGTWDVGRRGRRGRSGRRGREGRRG